MLDEKLTVRQKQLEELMEGSMKYKGLSGNALTALKIDLLVDGGSKMNLSDEANATKFAYELLDAKKVSGWKNRGLLGPPGPTRVAQVCSLALAIRLTLLRLHGAPRRIRW